jgi:putative colanic acid biosynthesis acetyltransferase WcaB
MNFFDLIKLISEDFKRNNKNYKSLVVLFFFRIASFFQLSNKNLVVFVLGIPFLIFYRINVEWILGIEIPAGCKIGGGIIVDHGQALVINRNVIIGKNCRLRNSTTIGIKMGKDGNYNSPIIGDNVDIGANVIIIGEILVGNNVIIGAGSVVTKDIPNNSVVVGNPARVINKI